MLIKRSILSMLMIAAAAPDAPAQAAAPRDVRGIFLALPFPEPREGGRVLQAFDGRLSTRTGREAALRGPVDVDTRNGYMAVSLPGANGAPMPAEAVLTYFSRADGKRLVVLQLRDWSTESEWPRTEDHAWILSGATFTRVALDDLLPNLEYRDFWDGTRPADLEKDFFMKMDAVYVEWPRQGTTAWFNIVEPPVEHGETPDPELAEVFRHRARTAVGLVWDRERGRFDKGEYQAYAPDEHDHHR